MRNCEISIAKINLDRKYGFTAQEEKEIENKKQKRSSNKSRCKKNGDSSFFSRFIRRAAEGKDLAPPKRTVGAGGAVSLEREAHGGYPPKS